MKKNQDLPQYIFLFILDAVRKDHLSLYGYPRKTSPNIDKLAKQADVYNWAFTPASYTTASVPSILAGKYPNDLSNLFTGGKFTNEDFSSLRKLQQEGYKTAMFTANIVTSHHQTNLPKFFDYFWDELTEKELNRPNFLYQKAEVVITAVKEFIKKNKNEKIFLVVHLMESHGPYTPYIESKFKNDQFYKRDKRQIDRVVNDMFSGVNFQMVKKYKVAPKYQLLNLITGPNGEIEDYERNVNEYIAKYDMGIYLQDSALKDFFDFLEKNKSFGGAKIIITADHGELLGEENIFFAHGIFTHPALIHVPLIVKTPNQTKKNVINRNFSLIELMGNGSNESDIAISIHPKSLSLINKKFLYLYHNGDLSHSEKIEETLFPVRNFSLEDFFRNFQKLSLENSLKYVFKRSETSFAKVGKHKEAPIFEKVIKIMTNSLKQHSQSAGGELRTLQNQINTLTQQNQELQTRFQNLDHQLSQKTQEAENFKNQLNSTLPLLETVKNTNEIFKKQIEELTSLVGLVKTEIEEKNRQIKKLKRQLKEIERQKRQEAKKIRQEEEKRIKGLQTENENIRQQIQQTQEHIQNLEGILNNIKSAKFFKLWQGYCKIMKVLKLKS